MLNSVAIAVGPLISNLLQSERFR